MKKIRLKKKSNVKPERKTIFNTGQLYYSGFCMTDNRNFSEFYLHRIPKLNYPFLHFAFQEKDMKYTLGDMVILNESVLTENIYLQYFQSKYINISFYALKVFMGQPVKEGSTVGIKHNGILVGIVKI